MIEPTAEMKAAFRAAQEKRAAELVAEGAPLGAHDILDRGLAAVLAIVERDRCMQPRGHVYHPVRRWPSGRGANHPHYCVSCSGGEAPGPGCGNCRSTGMDQTPWPRCEECRASAKPAADPFAPTVNPCTGCGCAKADHRDGHCIGDFGHCPCETWMPPSVADALPADEHHFDTACDDRPYCRIAEHHDVDAL